MGAKFVSNKDETIPLFKNPILEYFSHIHPLTPVVVFVPVVIVMMWMSVSHVSILATCAVFVGGVVLWTLIEYVIHRFAFHIHPTSTLGKKVHFLVHGIHHDYPRDSTRLVMPLLVSVPLALLFFLVFQAVVAPYHWALFGGFIAGYVAYDSIHYATHHWTMTGKVGRFLKEYHMKHHYVDDHTAYGVSNPLWDYVFGTVPEWARRRATQTKGNHGTH
ncbi:MAG: sterol desaturase family protein [Candidatus Kapabacteria bacterium]|jgi:sterol desaturase/sphingolipid hydroxylase (fatty acid hydroxylase superfamily)|nr:sterol desaturase family protein [Candidatus Kapabacteria bacterium]